MCKYIIKSLKVTEAIICRNKKEVFKVEEIIYKNRDSIKDIVNISKRSIDLLITDPPYWHVQGGMSSKKLNVGKFKKGSFMQEKLVMFKRKDIFNLLETLEDNKEIFKCGNIKGSFFCSKLQIPVYLEWARDNGYKASISIWDRKLNRMYSSKFYASDIDYIINISKELHEPKIYEYPQKMILHQTEKPVELMEDIIKDWLKGLDNKNICILDMFSGVGTTLKASNNLGLYSIGYEVDKVIYEMGKDNIKYIGGDNNGK